MNINSQCVFLFSIVANCHIIVMHVWEHKKNCILHAQRVRIWLIWHQRMELFIHLISQLVMQWPRVVERMRAAGNLTLNLLILFLTSESDRLRIQWYGDFTLSRLSLESNVNAFKYIENWTATTLHCCIRFQTWTA